MSAAFDVVNGLAVSTEKIIEECGKSGFVGNQTSWLKIFNFLKRKYLSLYEESLANDILVDAWSSVFLEKNHLKIKSFTGFNPETKKDVNIATYIMIYMRNAIINYSTKQTKIFLNEKQSFETEDETSEEKQERSGREKSGCKVYRLDEEELNLLKSYIKDKETILNSTEDAKAIKKIQKQIDNIQAQIDELTSATKTKKSVEWEDVYDTERDEAKEYEDELTFSDYVRKIRKSLNNKDKLIFLCLCYGLSKRDIACFLEQRNINSELERIVNKVKDFCSDIAFEEDNDTLYRELVNYLSMRDRKEVRFNNELSSRRNVYRSVKRALKDMLREDRATLNQLVKEYFNEDCIEDYI